MCPSSGHVGYLPGSFAGRRGLEPRHEECCRWVVFRWRPTSKLFVKQRIIRASLHLQYDRRGRMKDNTVPVAPGISTTLDPFELRTMRFLTTPSDVSQHIKSATSLIIDPAMRIKSHPLKKSVSRISAA